MKGKTRSVDKNETIPTAFSHLPIGAGLRFLLHPSASSRFPSLQLVAPNSALNHSHARATPQRETKALAIEMFCGQSRSAAHTMAPGLLNPAQRDRSFEMTLMTERLGDSKQDHAFAPASDPASAQHETARRSSVVSQKEIKGVRRTESSTEKKSYCL